MRTAVWIRALALTTVMASACGTTPTVGSAPSPTVSSVPASPSASPTAVNPCPPPSSRCLALVTLRGSNSYVVRDITDINHPTTVSSLAAITQPVFVNANEISFEDENGLERSPLGGSPTVVVNPGGGLFTWSPDGTTAIYVTLETATTAAVHQLTSAGDRVLGSMSIAAINSVGGCETIAGCAIENTLDLRLSYSPDGGVISLVINTFGGSFFRLWSADGKVLKSSDSQGLTMAVWSGNSLYFRDSNGVEVWRDGAVSSFLPGVAWIKPQASPAGGQIIYAARDNEGWAHTYVVDTASRAVRELKKARYGPAFLTSRYIWSAGERGCVAADACGATPPTHPLSGKTYIYDLQTGTETESIITGVSDVWPHPA
jgi:hypothetical protein